MKLTEDLQKQFLTLTKLVSGGMTKIWGNNELKYDESVNLLCDVFETCESSGTSGVNVLIDSAQRRVWAARKREQRDSVRVVGFESGDGIEEVATEPSIEENLETESQLEEIIRREKEIDKVCGKESGKIVRYIYENTHENDKPTREEISEALKIPLRTVERRMAALKKGGKLKFF